MPVIPKKKKVVKQSANRPPGISSSALTFADRRRQETKLGMRRTVSGDTVKARISELGSVVARRIRARRRAHYK